MSQPEHRKEVLMISVGTKIVSLRSVEVENGKTLHPAGAVGIVLRAPCENEPSYRVRFADGYEESLRREEIVMLAAYQEETDSLESPVIDRDELLQRVIYRCVIGSRAYGLDHEDSDVDYRGVYLPSAERHWSLFGVPAQIERYETQEHYWELQRFLVLALKSNPNVLECLYSPLVELQTSLGERLLEMRESFLSRLLYQTFNGYAISQFKKTQSDLKNHGIVKWKHVMHLLRLLITGAETLRTGVLPVRVELWRERLLAVKRGEIEWNEINEWRKTLHRDFDEAFATTRLPDRPNYELADAFLIDARRAALQEDKSP